VKHQNVPIRATVKQARLIALAEPPRYEPPQWRHQHFRRIKHHDIYIRSYLGIGTSTSAIASTGGVDQTSQAAPPTRCKARPSGWSASDAEGGDSIKRLRCLLAPNRLPDQVIIVFGELLLLMLLLNDAHGQPAVQSGNGKATTPTTLSAS
jgi:hypothetical protein